MVFCDDLLPCKRASIRRNPGWAAGGSSGGKIAEECWMQTESVRKNCRIHDFIIMPNHIHGIIEITSSAEPDFADSGKTKFTSPKGTIGAIVRGFKISTIKKIREWIGRGELQFAPTALKIIEIDFKIWQRNYYEHIIRNEESNRKISDYIRENPARWIEDKCFLSNPGWSSKTL
jgi:putative transposase